jgi:hypothetical protein
LVLLYEAPSGEKKWIVDPTYEECQALSNNLVFVCKSGEGTILSVGAEANRSSYSVQNSANLNYKSSTIGFGELRQGVRAAEEICQKALLLAAEQSGKQKYSIQL